MKHLPITYRPSGAINISQGYGSNPDKYPVFGGHEGIDISVAWGWPFHAVADGVVIHSSDRMWSDPNKLSDYGFHCMLEHDIGGVKFRSHYAHSDGRIPQVGQVLPAGSIVGYSGNTGRSTGYHLHFALLVDTQESFLKPSVFGYFVDPNFAMLYPVAEGV